MQQIFGPSWFYGLDSSFEFIAMFITLFIALFTLRIYLLMRQRKYLYFTLSFVMISVSYFIRGATDWLAYTHFLGKIPNVTAAASKIAAIPTLHSFGFLFHIFLMLAGFMILVAVFMGITDFLTVSLMFTFAIILTALAQSKFMAFHLTLIVMLLFIIFHLIRNYQRTRTLNAFLVLYSMTALLAAQVFFMLITIGPFYYVVGHALQLVGFLLLLLTMILVLR
jgi:hypothetical protein